MSVTTTRAETARSAIAPAAAVIGIGLLAIIAIFWPEGRAAVRVWYESTAYGHCFLVLPIAIYLAWDRRDALRGLLPNPTPALVLLGLPLPLIWLAAERLGIMEGRQLVAIAAIELLFLAVLGWRLFAALSGPLLYLFFLVPFGAFLTPVLQTFTARFIDLGLGVLGIPHYITDMVIEIGAGTFFVAEACAGLRFLIASIAFGVFFALLNYNSWGRRAAFIAASIIVPIIANGFRALGIVVLGNILGSAQAAAADHIIYGWFFFSFVTFLLVLAGLPFRQPIPLPSSRARHTVLRTTPARAAILVAVLAAVGPAAAVALDHYIAPVRFTARPALVAPAGCTITPGAAAPTDRVAYTMDCAGRVWTVTAQAVPARSTGAALTDARRILVGPVEDDEATTGTLPGTAWQTIVAHDPGLVVAATSWVNGQPATGGIAGRLDQARNSLLGATIPPATMVLAYRPGQPLSDPQITAALADLTAFVAAQPTLTTDLAAVIK